MKIDLRETLAKLPLPATEKWREGVWDTEVFERGELRLIIFAPRNHDYQTAHEQDELYVIVAGSGEFQREGKVEAFAQGDVLFVEAGRAHRFVKFSDDFVAWVIFWGPRIGR